MNEETTSQRFLDHHGRRLDRRAVRVEDDALVIETWDGHEQRLPWVDVVGLQRQSARGFEVMTVDGVLRFDRHVEGLEQLAQAIRHARAAADAVPGEADIARWLGGGYHVVADLGPTDARHITLVGTLALPLFVLFELACLFVPGLSSEWMACGMALVFAFAVLALLADVAAAVGRSMEPRVRPRRPYTLATRLGAWVWDEQVLIVNPSGVTLRSSSSARHLRWEEIRRCEPARDGGLRLTPKHLAADMLIPASPRFVEAGRAIARVVRGLSAVQLDGALPHGALSRARLADEEETRGLSRVESEDAAS
jgi:hypothetical protein